LEVRSLTVTEGNAGQEGFTHRIWGKHREGEKNYPGRGVWEQERDSKFWRGSYRPFKEKENMEISGVRQPGSVKNMECAHEQGKIRGLVGNKAI